MALLCFQSWFKYFYGSSGLAILCLFFLQSHKFSSVLILSWKNRHHDHPYHHGRPMFQANQTGCSLFSGAWIPDETYPIYRSSACPIIDPQFNCQLYGRPDSDYLKYRWKPSNCELPRFDGQDFLAKMRGKTMMFVGDSLGRNQWESLICMTLEGVPGSPTQMSAGDPLSIFKFLEYDVTVSFYKATYLVDIDILQGKRVLRLGDIRGNGNAWWGVDVLSFNTGHWWNHRGALQGWDYMEWGGTMYQDMNRLDALEKGLTTWATWVENNVDPTKTRVFFQSTSPSHYNPSEWSAGAGRSCYGETEPTRGPEFPGVYPDQMKVVEGVISHMSVPIFVLDITTLSAMRKDAHPSIYSGDLSPEQRANPDHSAADCSHWCLPGIPDTWNQLFYTALLY